MAVPDADDCDDIHVSAVTKGVGSRSKREIQLLAVRSIIQGSSSLRVIAKKSDAIKNSPRHAGRSRWTLIFKKEEEPTHILQRLRKPDYFGHGDSLSLPQDKSHASTSSCAMA